MGTQPVAPGRVFLSLHVGLGTFSGWSWSPLPSLAPGPLKAAVSSKLSLLQAKCSIIPVLIWGVGAVSLCSFFKTQNVSIPSLLGSGQVPRPGVGGGPAPPWKH